uniref:Uncharacterized protein n=1 Tax=Plectus sambesii TaxID=2011161 RepID=A0A914WAD1_9BILA
MMHAVKTTVTLFALGLLLLVATDAVEIEDKRAQSVMYEQNGLPRMRFGRSSGGPTAEYQDVKRPQWDDIGWVWGKRAAWSSQGTWNARPGRPGVVKKNPDWHDLGWTWGRKGEGRVRTQAYSTDSSNVADRGIARLNRRTEMHTFTTAATFLFVLAIVPVSAISLLDRNDKTDSSENKATNLAEGKATQNKDWMPDFNNRDFTRFGNMKRGGARAFSGGSRPYRFSDYSDYLYALAKRTNDELEKRGGGRAFAPNYWNGDR